MIQVGNVNPRVFLIGGGDYKTLPDSMFQCREMLRGQSCYFVQKKNLQYARHGHSLTSIAEKYIMVTGSRKEVSNASQKVELYDTVNDEWMELSDINTGRHYHSSCTFDNKFVFLFGGIKNSDKKYVNSIEKLSFTMNNFMNKWEPINMNDAGLYINKSLPVPSRQGSGMTQFSPTEIMIMGGFNGKFMNDYYVMKVDGSGYLNNISALTRNNSLALFPF